jgi:hypothetical protein
VVVYARQRHHWKEITRKEYLSAGHVDSGSFECLALANYEVGGSTDSQKEFLQALSTDDIGKSDRQSSKQPPLANNFALGYTYHDVLDADHEGTFTQICLFSRTATNLKQTYSHGSPYTYSPTHHRLSHPFYNPS